MKRRKYIKPVIEIIKTEPADIICLSYAIKDNGDDSEYIIPPSIAGNTEWSEDESGGGGIWGDLD
ncbi:MAG: hypothetical protein K2H16_09570 [Prevotella sp.]|nr:hypothetical protein [Prevotella sp.]MDE6151412.1 hypothetical protein [Prevotella sp.]